MASIASHMGQTLSRWSKKEPVGPQLVAVPGRTNTKAAPGQPYIVARQPRTDNEAATTPHQNNQRPDKGKLTQAKKVIASGMSEAEAIDLAKAGDAQAFEGLYGLHKRRVY